MKSADRTTRMTKHTRSRRREMVKLFIEVVLLLFGSSNLLMGSFYRDAEYCSFNISVVLIVFGLALMGFSVLMISSSVLLLTDRAKTAELFRMAAGFVSLSIFAILIWASVVVFGKT